MITARVRSVLILSAFAGSLALVGTAGAESPPGKAGAPEAGTGSGEKALTNDDVVKLCKLGLGDEVVITKINAARSVSFALEADDLVDLKDRGVSDAVVSAMIKRTSTAQVGAPLTPGGPAWPMGPGVATGSAVPRTVRMESQEGTIDLAAKAGSARSIVAPFVGFLRSMRYPGVRAEVRISDRRPSFLVHCEGSPATKFWVVKLDVDDDEDEMHRSVDLQSPGMFGGEMSNEPDEEVVMATSAVEEHPGLWRLTLTKKDLKPGEYGIYSVTGDLYDFGIDK